MGIREIKKLLQENGFDDEFSQHALAGLKTVNKPYQKTLYGLLEVTLERTATYYRQDNDRDWWGVSDFEIIQELNRFEDPNFEFLIEENTRTFQEMLKRLDFSAYYHLHMYFHFVFKERKALDGEVVRRNFFYLETD